MASEDNSLNLDFKTLEDEIARVFDTIHKLVDERKEIIMRRLNNLRKSYERNFEANSALKQLQQFRDAGANLLTSNLLEASKLISLDVIDQQIEDLQNKQASISILSKHELVWDESEMRSVLDKVNLILADPAYSKRSLPNQSTCKLGKAEGELCIPYYLALVEERDEVYIADSGNHRIVVHNLEGIFLRRFGTVNIESPRGIAITAEAVFVTDNLVHALYKLNLDGVIVKQIKREGGLNAEFLNPTGVACYRSEVYVCDFNNNRIQIFDRNLNFKRKICHKELDLPSDILFTKNYFFILATVNNTILQYTKEDKLISVIHLKGQKSPINEAYFFARDKHKKFLISDKYGDCIKVFSKQGNLENTLGMGSVHFPRGIAVTEDSRVIHVCENKEGAFQIY